MRLLDLRPQRRRDRSPPRRPRRPRPAHPDLWMLDHPPQSPAAEVSAGAAARAGSRGRWAGGVRRYRKRSWSSPPTTWTNNGASTRLCLPAPTARPSRIAAATTLTRLHGRWAPGADLRTEAQSGLPRKLLAARDQWFGLRCAPTSR